MSKKLVNGAWEELTGHKKPVNSAWEDCTAGFKVVSGAWESIWEKHTPIIKDGVWMYSNTDELYGSANADYSGYINGLPLTYGKLRAEEDEDECRGVNIDITWTLTFDRIPKAIYIEGWVDGGFEAGTGQMIITNGNYSSNVKNYQLGNSGLGVITYNNGMWIDLSDYQAQQILKLKLTFNKWFQTFSTNADYYYYQAYSNFVPAWKINNLWIKF